MEENNSKTILLVEDEAIIAMEEERLLYNSGYAVIKALNGEKAVAMVRSHTGPIDLILMDIDLGKGMDGAEAAREILKIRDIPVVFLSSHTEKEIVDKTEKITSYGYVVKNSGITVLDASIKTAFRLFDAHRKILTRKMEIEAASEELRQAVSRKEILMKEFQHRVKNNFNVVSSLLRLEKNSLTDDVSVRVFENAISRINSMSAIYERLYHSSDPSSIELHTYIRGLADSMLKLYAVDSGRISLTTRLAEVRLDTRRTAPLGLILNELISNALKHAFPPGKGGEITIELDASGEKITLSVADNGTGLPENIEPGGAGSMGLNLVKMLAGQIEGDLLIESREGTRVCVELKL